jgi:hypothetical protein
LNLAYEDSEARRDNTAQLSLSNNAQRSVKPHYNAQDFAEDNIIKHKFKKSSKQARKQWLAFFF